MWFNVCKFFNLLYSKLLSLHHQSHHHNPYLQPMQARLSLNVNKLFFPKITASILLLVKLTSSIKSYSFTTENIVTFRYPQLELKWNGLKSVGTAL